MARFDFEMANVEEARFGYAKAVALRRMLTRGLAAWRAAPREEPRFLSAAVLRGALRYLQAGYRLDEAQSELVLRSALYHGVGVVTALRCQHSDQNVADAVFDALVDNRPSLALAVLWRMQRASDGPARWQARVAEELHAVLPTVGIRQRAHLSAACYQLETGLPIVEEAPREEGPKEQVYGAVPGASARQDHDPAAGDVVFNRWARRMVVLVPLLLIAGYVLFNGLFNAPADASELAYIPGGDYLVNDPGQSRGSRVVFVNEFYIMPKEVTNREYRRCVESGACLPPVSPDSARRANYFTDPAYDAHPVVHVRWRDAVDYCGWREMRLPSAREWEAAASFSPLTGQQYRYPWGDRFEPRFVNYGGSDHGDSQPVGAYHPHGSTPTHVRDMAGNVAEWTMSPGGASATTQIVKGGSFLDGPEELTVYAQRLVDPQTAAAWLGFRCVR